VVTYIFLFIWVIIFVSLLSKGDDFPIIALMFMLEFLNNYQRFDTCFLDKENAL
jgi:hypothetical protein